MKTEFIARVMQVMNELGWDDPGSDAFIGSDTTKVEKHIEAVFTDAWRKAVNLLPKTYFTVCDFSGQAISPDISKGTGYVVLPPDFHKLASFKMKGWQKAAETLHDSSDPIASVQANEYTRGNICRPVCVKNIRETGEGINTVLEYYSLYKGMRHEISEALYIPVTAPLSDDTVISGKLFIPLAYLCAGMVFEIFEKPGMAKVMEAKAIETKA
ncbi:hypothetical protein IR083_19825 [Dysgonomonas sp. GY75]|uniref:hypothetical protein n=1 Tax=Dysgonomonas sp. GY75 TaxID=2780419 RepID=UPI001883456E|nr:hypothetical protein [Dysgonomonas sp. GY75]MBF0651069.1 hypothetical protein [Dysgonomonas sp. GY75]